MSFKSLLIYIQFPLSSSLTFFEFYVIKKPSDLIHRISLFHLLLGSFALMVSFNVLLPFAFPVVQWNQRAEHIQSIHTRPARAGPEDSVPKHPQFFGKH